MQRSNISSIFEHILKNVDNKDREKVELYQTKYEKYMFWGMFLSFLLALLVAIYANYFNTYFSIQGLKLWSLSLLTISLILVMIYEIVFIYRGFKNFKGMTQTFLHPIAKSAVRNYEFSKSLIHFNKEELLYVSKTLSLELEQMKKRISMMIGLIDKVGIIPALVSLVFVIYKNANDIESIYDKFDWIAYGFIGIFIIGIIALSSIPKIEQYILLLDTAINLKEKNHLDTDIKEITV